MRPWLQFLCLLAALMTAPVAGCSDPASPPTTGTLEVTTTTPGETDSLSYSLQVDGSIRTTVAANGRATIAGLASGVHAVALLDLPARCNTPEASARSVEITAATTTTVHFDITCAAPGSLRVVASMAGDSLDPDGFTVIVAGVAKQASGAVDTVVFENLSPGDVPVSLAGIAPNCGVDGAPTVTAHIASGAQTTIAIAVRCRAPGAGGEIRVVVNTALINAPAIHSFSLVLDRLRTMPVPANGAASFTGVTAGTHSVRLNVAPYCSVGGFFPAPNPVSVVVPVNGTATVRFSVLCIG
jgi:hypothetical protein